ncbi:hypothetical protein [Pseudanabaena sp. ABRG5-3]|uniref:hypothetical protein n=1 Tax=Pseudanabaena sp. ABRG5-3 TaxID=685565 RepID=UPI000DC71BCC|nr:hypothetical protein [Pseudanabaena sp. ABRG5-3]BBC23023.1 hypothetical protein ABRG53_0766 [Pseudanabaena sp. ABRG5-3]
MKKSSIYRTLQIAAAVTIYSVTSIWASENHVDIVSHTITNINTLLVILAIAVVFPYLCFKALGKIYTPPASRFRDEASRVNDVDSDENESNAIAINKDLEIMQYRGIPYKPEDLVTKQATNQSNNQSDNSAPPVIKYRGAIITNSDTPSTTSDSLPSNQPIQKSAKPKERMKYRGSYID